MMAASLRGLGIGFALLAVWQVAVWLAAPPAFILPGPAQVLGTWAARLDLILPHAAVTALEIVLGLLIGTLLGAGSALLLGQWRGARRWLLPVLVISQALPVFALAPMLVLWFGYGLASKVAMATLIIYFPVAAAFYDGLRRTEPGWIDLARTMAGHSPGARWALLRHIRLPAALPALASGLRIAAAAAPIGAVIGEWVGSSAGLGYLMLHANGRMQTDLMFAALFTLALLALALYLSVDFLLRRLLPWQPDSLRADTAGA